MALWTVNPFFPQVYIQESTANFLPRRLGYITLLAHDMINIERIFWFISGMDHISIYNQSFPFYYAIEDWLWHYFGIQNLLKQNLYKVWKKG